MKKILYFLLIVMFFTSCIYDKISHLENEELAWMEPYEEGDTILFASSLDVDTMVVEKKKLYNSLSPFREDEGISTYNANSVFDSTIEHDEVSIHVFFMIFKEHDGRLRVSLTIHRRRFEIEDDKKINYGSVKIGDVAYHDVIRVDNGNSKANSIAPIANEYFIWSKSKGLLQYKYLNGEVYTFYKKLPCKK